MNKAVYRDQNAHQNEDTADTDADPTRKPYYAAAPSKRAASRKHRVFVFREFILQTYGSYLKANDVILDMAGGKGDLSWLLTNVDDFASYVVDPRSPKDHLIRSVQFLRQYPEEATLRAIPNQPTHQPLAKLLPVLERKQFQFSSPGHWRVLVDDDLVEAVKLVLAAQPCCMASNRLCASYDPPCIVTDEWRTFWNRALGKAQDILHEQQMRQHRTCVIIGSAQNEGKGSQVSWVTRDDMAADGALLILLRTRLIVGFHPDQATDASLDLATALQIPYCIVPCCVFPSEFPHRRLPNGTRVKFHRELITYLQHRMDTAKPKVRIASLPFQMAGKDARNTVLFTLPEDYKFE